MHTHTNALIICSIFELIFQLKNTFKPYWLRSTFTQRRNTSSGQRVPLQCVAIKLINIELETHTPPSPSFPKTSTLTNIHSTILPRSQPLIRIIWKREQIKIIEIKKKRIHLSRPIIWSKYYQIMRATQHTQLSCSFSSS